MTVKNRVRKVAVVLSLVGVSGTFAANLQVADSAADISSLLNTIQAETAVQLNQQMESSERAVVNFGIKQQRKTRKPRWFAGAHTRKGVKEQECWVVQNNKSGEIQFRLNRRLLTEDLTLDLVQRIEGDCRIELDLLDIRGNVLVDNLFSFPSTEGQKELGRYALPLKNNPNAARIRIAVDAGQMGVAKFYSASLYIDRDGDGLDASQEELYGTSDFMADSDEDGLNDYTEVFITHTDPLVFDSDGDGLSDGEEVENGLNPLYASCLDLAFGKAVATGTNMVFAAMGTEVKNETGNIKYYKNIEELLNDDACPAFVFVDVDGLYDVVYTLSDLIKAATDKQIGLIFESASGNTDNMHIFATTELYGCVIPFQIDGLVIEVQDDGFAHTLISDENAISKDFAVGYCFPKLEALEEEMLASLEEADGEEEGEPAPLTASSRITKWNQSPDAILKQYPGYIYKSDPSPIHVTKTVYTKQGNKYRKMIKKDNRAYSNNKGSCRFQKTVGHSNSISFSKSWSVSINNGFKIKLSPAVEATFGASWSYGQSKTTGQTWSVTKKAARENIQGGVFQMVKKCDGYHEGYVDFSITKGTTSREQHFNAKAFRIKYDKKADLSFKNTEIPVSQPFYDFNEWGKLLPKCK